MKMILLKDCWVIVDEQSMILAVMDDTQKDIEQAYKDACNKIISGEYEICVEDVSGAMMAIIEGVVVSTRIYTTQDKTRDALQEVLNFMQGETDGN